MKSAITSIFTDKFKEQSDEYINLLFKLAKMGGSTVQDRIEKVSDVTEAYYERVGQHMASDKLDRLSTLILYDDHHDTTPYKVKNTEHPSLNWRQLKRRSEFDVGDRWFDTIRSEGKDHRLPTRTVNRERREKMKLI